jgi:putative ABC transport system ATP-binding protein
VTQTYQDGAATIHALSGLSHDFLFGEFTAITGPSGSGKSTLLRILSGIEYADDGSITIGETELGSLSTVEQTEFRASHISFLMPEFNLIPMLSVYENITLSLSVQRLSEVEIDGRATESLSRLGIEELADRRPARLSSGQRARASLARAIATRTPVLVADEPTARLDAGNSAMVASLLADIARSPHRCVIVATHDPVVTAAATTVVNLRAGRGQS